MRHGLPQLHEHGSVPLSRVPRRLSSRVRWYREPLEQEMEEELGWIDSRRKATRQRLIGGTIVIVLVGGATMVAGLIVASSALAREAATALNRGAVVAGVGGALDLLRLAALIAGAIFSPLSEEGEQAAAAWKSYRDYLKAILRGQEFAAGEALFECCLPYAAGFGLGPSWAKHFQKQGDTAMPAWFQALDASKEDFSAVVAVMASTHASFSAGSGGSGSAASASGGGASGAG